MAAVGGRFAVTFDDGWWGRREHGRRRGLVVGAGRGNRPVQQVIHHLLELVLRRRRVTAITAGVTATMSTRCRVSRAEQVRPAEGGMQRSKNIFVGIYHLVEGAIGIEVEFFDQFLQS